MEGWVLAADENNGKLNSGYQRFHRSGVGIFQQQGKMTELKSEMGWHWDPAISITFSHCLAMAWCCKIAPGQSLCAQLQHGQSPLLMNTVLGWQP